jgi:hypothetical protein
LNSKLKIRISKQDSNREIQKLASERLNHQNLARYFECRFCFGFLASDFEIAFPVTVFYNIAGKKTQPINLCKSLGRNPEVKHKFSPAPEKRFDIVRRIKRETKNVKSGILHIPLIPYLADPKLRWSRWFRRAPTQAPITCFLAAA